MIVTTKKVICKSKIFEEDAIELEIKDEGAGCYLAVGSVGSSEHEKIFFESKKEISDFYNTAFDMLINAQSQCEEEQLK